MLGVWGLAVEVEMTMSFFTYALISFQDISFLDCPTPAPALPYVSEFYQTDQVLLSLISQDLLHLWL